MAPMGQGSPSAYGSPVVDMYEQLREYRTEALEAELERRKVQACGPHLPRTDAGTMSVVSLVGGDRYISCQRGRFKWYAREVPQ